MAIEIGTKVKVIDSAYSQSKYGDFGVVASIHQRNFTSYYLVDMDAGFQQLFEEGEIQEAGLEGLLDSLKNQLMTLEGYRCLDLRRGIESNSAYDNLIAGVKELRRRVVEQGKHMADDLFEEYLKDAGFLK